MRSSKPKANARLSNQLPKVLKQTPANIGSLLRPLNRKNRHGAPLIREFLRHFERKERVLRLVSPVPPDILEALARPLNNYWKKGGSLDNWFGTKGKGKGARTPRETLLAEEQQMRITFRYAIYLEEERERRQKRRTAPLQGEPTPAEVAIQRAAKELSVSEAVVKEAVNRKTPRTKL